MIAYLSGVVRDVHVSTMTVVVNGIGFRVQVPAHYAIKVGSTVELEIYTHVNEEHGMQLFGFRHKDERLVFQLVIGCSGIGPKIALALLNNLTPSLLVSAILMGDVKALSSVEGIGTKKAENIIMQLKDKIGKLSLSSGGDSQSPAISHIKQLSDVLVSLGYSRMEITRGLTHLQESKLLEHSSFDELLRKALAFLAKK